MQNIKAIIFDIDGTLTDNHSWIDTTRGFGASVDEHREIYKEFLENKIDLVESKRRLVEIWNATGNVNQKFWTDLCNSWELKSDALEAVEYLRNKGYILAIISGGFEIYVEIIAKKLQIENWYSTSKLYWDETGKLVDFEYYQDDAEQKYKRFELFKSKFSIDDSEAAMVGDGDNDLVLFQKLGFSIAVKPYDAKLIPYAKKEIDNLSELKNIF